MDRDSKGRDCFGPSRQRFEAILGFLGSGAGALSHSELESQLQAEGFELLRQLFQDHLDLRAQREQRLGEVVGSDGVCRRYAEAGHCRPLATVFGEVTVSRLAYRHKRTANLCPADGALNLPEEPYSHGLRRLAAVEASRGSFDEAVSAIERSSAAHAPKRQVEQLTARAATDVEDFYATREHAEAAPSDVLVVSADDKGIVMRPEGLRPATAKAAAASTNKLAARLSKGEKRNRKRLAEVGAVYDLAPVARSAVTCWRPRTLTATNGPQPPRLPTSASPPAWSTTQPKYWGKSSTRQSGGAPGTAGNGSRWWTATSTRSR
jgi:hypothetical protein